MSTPNFSDQSTNYQNKIANLNFTFNAGNIPLFIILTSSTDLTNLIGNQVSNIMSQLATNATNNNLNSNASTADNLNNVLQTIKNQVLVNGVPNSQDPTELTALLELEFARSLNIPVNPSDLSTGSTFTASTPSDLGDLQDLYEGLVNGQPPLTQTPSQFISTLFTNAFNFFITSDLSGQNFPTTANPTDGTWFANNWATFLTSISTEDASTPGSIPGLNTTQGIQGSGSFGVSDGTLFGHQLAQSINLPNINSYSQIFFAFNPQATQADFQSFLGNFYTQQVKKNGYFIPSQSLGDFFAGTVQQSKINAHSLGLLADNSADATAIIFRVFALLTTMTSTLQNVASTQAQVLNFYADLEKAYTNMTSKLPNIGAGNIIQDAGLGFGGPYTSGDTNNSEVTSGQQMISTQNQAYGTQLRDFRSVIQNQAQQQQTAVDQSNQAVNQQASLATTLLQQMSTILTAIYTTASA